MGVSFYTVCCAQSNSKFNVKCIAPATEISSCENLIDEPVLNVAIWYLALMAGFGNIIAFLYNVNYVRSDDAGAYHFLMLNLSCADFLMGVYLYIIAIINLHYTGEYGLNDNVWRHSTLCTLSGIIASLSSEASAFIVLLITMDRFIAVKYPFSDLKLTRRGASVLLIIAWSVSLFLALIPLIPDPSLENFYAQSGICVSLPLSITRKSGWQFSMIVYVGINFFLFLGIVVGQISIFVEVFNVGRSVQSTNTILREVSSAQTLFAIVLTDVSCWILIGTIGMLTFLGIEVQPDVYAWMIVVVLPINSAINPILYLLTTFIKNKKGKDGENIPQMKNIQDSAKLRSESTSQRTISTVSGSYSDSSDLQNRPSDQRIESQKEKITKEQETIESQQKRIESQENRVKTGKDIATTEKDPVTTEKGPITREKVTVTIGKVPITTGNQPQTKVKLSPLKGPPYQIS
ncbi:G-protein coupled receptor GRL101-like [Saccostrea echinata]|uniref:G-protein coupled receptor GRL101-like n=1 Tax=Saccostrea echinata TaxID=191078 RepID=UPI002A7F74B6|nr:G-protein coupled receptor GRL101-like [Saccostrea echinata]